MYHTLKALIRLVDREYQLTVFRIKLVSFCELSLDQAPLFEGTSFAKFIFVDVYIADDNFNLTKLMQPSIKTTKSGPIVTKICGSDVK